MEATEQLILFTEAFLNEGPVKICPAPASKPVSRESVPGSGLKCSAWCEKYALIGSWLKTCVERSISPCQPSSPVWKEKATKCGQASFQLLHLERRTSESDSSSLLPTPVVMDSVGARNSTAWRSNSNHNINIGDTLTDVFWKMAQERGEMLPTPRATDGTKGGPNQRGSSGDLMLPSAVMNLE